MCYVGLILCLFFFFKQKTAYEMRISDWSSDVCSSDLVRPIDRHALRFMDGRRIAMIDMGIVFQVERDRSTVVEPDRHMLWRNPLDLTQRAVLHPKPALVLEEHDAVAAGELPRAPLGLHLHVGTKRSRV